MTDKVLCPWCGEEMWKPDIPWERGQPEMGEYVYTTQGKCRHCGALTPKVYGRTPKEAVENYFAAALRRYEPPIRPMTLEEVKLKYCGIIEGAALLIEEKFGPLSWAVLDRSKGKIVATWNCYGLENYCEDDYGHTWRCWPRKPTEQERESYGWEDAE